ncbi:cell cycle control tyrosine phosphatase Mih1 [Cordyceps militaris]|uniref:Cell cycle control tyrosine phosphatase Mih1 n=1 Tax=Cordyceps militaris TaxID=73501 RepID=A0A2H4SKQ7_CORMI|nr:cell cycle control tyrosine phosphatase Mih1 [Cordyceps militaris]
MPQRFTESNELEHTQVRNEFILFLEEKPSTSKTTLHYSVDVVCILRCDAYLDRQCDKRLACGLEMSAMRDMQRTDTTAAFDAGGEGEEGTLYISVVMCMKH